MDEAFWREVPVGPDSLTRKRNFRDLLISDLRKPEIGQLDLTVLEQDILRLDIIMDDGALESVEIVDKAQQLPRDEPGLALGGYGVLLHVDREIGPVAELHHRAEGVLVDLDGVVEHDDILMAQLLVNLVLTKRMLDVVGLVGLRPAAAQLVDLAGDPAHFDDVKGFVDLAESALAKETHDLVSLVQNRPATAPGVVVLVVESAGGLFLESSNLHLQINLLHIQRLQSILRQLNPLLLQHLLKIQPRQLQILILLHRRSQK